MESISHMAVTIDEAYETYTLQQTTNEHLDGQFIGKYWNPLPESIVNRIKGKSYKEDCPVALTDLAYIQVTHWNLENQIVTGELVVHKNLASEIILIFKELFDIQFPIAKMVLIDDYNADDDLSTADNNSSAFCSRTVRKTGIFSKHSYGGAIDLNPLFNPFVQGETVSPIGAEKYRDRSQDIPGMIKKDDACYDIFIKRGYAWGGNWIKLKDYQHFEKDPETFIK